MSDAPADAFLTGDPEEQRKAVLAAIERIREKDRLLPPTTDSAGRPLLRCWICAYPTWSKGRLRDHLRRRHPGEWAKPHPKGWSSPRGLGRADVALLQRSKGIEQVKEELSRGEFAP